MLHVRVIAPPESTSEVLQLLDASPAVTHLCVTENGGPQTIGRCRQFRRRPGECD